MNLYFLLDDDFILFGVIDESGIEWYADQWYNYHLS